jgi:RNA polymerase sigma-54 factor
MCYSDANPGPTNNTTLQRMALQAKQTIHQRLMLAPNVTLALEVLRMPVWELRAFLERQMEENPCLELEEPTDDEDVQPMSDQTNGKEALHETGLDEDWLSHWRTVGEWEDPESADAAEDRRVEQRLIIPQSLCESLRMQLGCQQLPEEERRLGEVIIQRLDENGYLEGSLEELSAETGASIEQLEAGLGLIQRCDPPGIGARNLRECLMIQLEQQGHCGTLAHRILKDHFQLFVQHRFQTIAKAAGMSLEQVTEACEGLKRLNPKPGCAMNGELSPSVVPDLIIHHRENYYDVELNDQDLPHVMMSRTYRRMLTDPRTPDDAKEFLLNKFRKASWLIKAIDERNTTLLSISRCLISLQRDFLVHGLGAIKPLTQAQVASLIGRHPSTVSRAICGKTIDTPYGVFPLEQLFASSVHQTAQTNATQTSEVSNEKIKSEIRHLIAEEDPHHSLSDAALAKQLSQRQISVARRTIAKYRTSLKILPAHLRKRRL